MSNYCPYCGPFQRCQAAEPDECWVVTQSEEEPLDQDTFVCKEGHYHDGPVLGRRGRDGEKCPEERVSDFVTAGVEYDDAVERVYG